MRRCHSEGGRPGQGPRDFLLQERTPASHQVWTGRPVRVRVPMPDEICFRSTRVSPRAESWVKSGWLPRDDVSQETPASAKLLRSTERLQMFATSGLSDERDGRHDGCAACRCQGRCGGAKGPRLRLAPPGKSCPASVSVDVAVIRHLRAEAQRCPGGEARDLRRLPEGWGAVGGTAITVRGKRATWTSRGGTWTLLRSLQGTEKCF